MNIILGPSHVVRFMRESVHFNDITADNEFICKGGMPVWCDYSLAELDKKYNKQDRVYIMVGDFRLGNKAVSNNVNCSQEFYGIDKASINNEVDMECYKKCLSALDVLVDRYNARLIFWSLALREYKNKKDGKYLSKDGYYNHPIWNLDVLERSYSSNVISMKRPCDIFAEKLEIDSSNHPSYLGYELLKNILLHQKTVDEAILDSLLYYSSSSVVKFSSKVVVCGVSPLYRGIKLYADKRLLVFENLSVYSAEDALFNKFRGCDTLIYFANEVDAKSLRFLPKAKYKNKIVVIRESKDVNVYLFGEDTLTKLYVYSLDNDDLEITMDRLNYKGVKYLMSSLAELVEEL